MNFTTLCDAALSKVALSEADRNKPLLKRRMEIVNSQIRLVSRSLRIMQSLRADIEALRIGNSDRFEGTGSCEHGGEDVGVSLCWPNLAILLDDLKGLLDEIKTSDFPVGHYVFYGQCEHAWYSSAAETEQVILEFGDEYPDTVPDVVVPSDRYGCLVFQAYGEEFVHCPKCSARTDFVELPRDGWQHHTCLNQACQHSFLAVPREEEVVA